MGMTKHDFEVETWFNSQQVIIRGGSFQAGSALVLTEKQVLDLYTDLERAYQELRKRCYKCGERGWKEYDTEDCGCCHNYVWFCKSCWDARFPPKPICSECGKTKEL
jgi:uncharacterized OB-fold protein